MAKKEPDSATSAKLWLIPDKLRNNMDAAEYKLFVLGMILLKYISDSFEEQPASLAARRDGRVQVR